jgi:hypothetical protein
MPINKEFLDRANVRNFRGLLGSNSWETLEFLLKQDKVIPIEKVIRVPKNLSKSV